MRGERLVEEEEEERTCPLCNSIVQPGESECYLCGADIIENGLNYDLEDEEDGEFEFD